MHSLLYRFVAIIFRSSSERKSPLRICLFPMNILMNFSPHRIGNDRSVHKLSAWLERALIQYVRPTHVIFGWWSTNSILQCNHPHAKYAISNYASSISYILYKSAAFHIRYIVWYIIISDGTHNAQTVCTQCWLFNGTVGVPNFDYNQIYLAHDCTPPTDIYLRLACLSWWRLIIIFRQSQMQ